MDSTELLRGLTVGKEKALSSWSEEEEESGESRREERLGVDDERGINELPPIADEEKGDPKVDPEIIEPPLLLLPLLPLPLIGDAPAEAIIDPNRDPEDGDVEGEGAEGRGRSESSRPNEKKESLVSDVRRLVGG